MAPLAANSLELPCGLRLTNRLVKAGMEECLARMLEGLPTAAHETLYRTWAEESQFGLLITGNVQVDATHLGTPFDVCIPATPLSSSSSSGTDLTASPNSNTDLVAKTTERWAAWKNACGDVPCLVQLNHPGRQSPRGLGRLPWQPALTPSKVPMSSGTSFAGKAFEGLSFGPVKEATKQELHNVVGQFVHGALQVSRAGFAGVQIHCSHGYLLSQMLSPKTNKRTDEYGQTPRDRLRLLFEIIDGIRKACPPDFCVSVKINSQDFVTGGLNESEALEQFGWILEHGGVDIIEISGGSYENPEFAAEPMGRGSNNQAFFVNFSKLCKAKLNAARAASSDPDKVWPAVMLTGGFRTQSAIEDSLADQASTADLIGLGRPACVDHTWPARMLDTEPQPGRRDCILYQPEGIQTLQRWMPLKIAGYGLGTGWHTFQMWKMSHKEEVKPQRTFARLAFDELIPAWVKGTAIMGTVAFFNYHLNPHRLGWGGPSAMYEGHQE